MEASVGDERFDPYYRKIRLGLRPMSHGARAQVASDWSGIDVATSSPRSASAGCPARTMGSGDPPRARSDPSSGRLQERLKLRSSSASTT